MALIADWAIVEAIRIMTTVKGKGMMAVIVVEGMTWGDLCGKQEKALCGVQLIIHPSAPQARRSSAKVGTCKTPPPWLPGWWCRKCSGSPSIFASQSMTFISSSVHAGLEACETESSFIQEVPGHQDCTPPPAPSAPETHVSALALPGPHAISGNLTYLPPGQGLSVRPYAPFSPHPLPNCRGERHRALDRCPSSTSRSLS